jgi:hypothetical protein
MSFSEYTMDRCLIYRISLYYFERRFCINVLLDIDDGRAAGTTAARTY